MARGYLVSLFNIPPLIFKFQFNPDLMQEKKTFKYKDANAFGKWAFDKTEAGGFFGLLEDFKEFGPLLTATKPIEPEEGEPRQFTLEFALDATTGPDDEGGQPRYDGSILPDLAILRSFMAPTWDALDIIKWVATKTTPCWSRPPECSLVFGGLSLTCQMTDLQIKHVAFNTVGWPSRAEITVTLKEQTFSFATITDFFIRYIDVFTSYTRFGSGEQFRSELVDISPTIFGMFE